MPMFTETVTFADALPPQATCVIKSNVASQSVAAVFTSDCCCPAELHSKLIIVLTLPPSGAVQIPPLAMSWAPLFTRVVCMLAVYANAVIGAPK